MIPAETGPRDAVLRAGEVDDVCAVCVSRSDAQDGVEGAFRVSLRVLEAGAGENGGWEVVEEGVELACLHVVVYHV